jgi:3-hydroxybutyryl-CoA dehydrogenase
MKLDDIHHIAVIGAGTMGAGMAWCFAEAGFSVSLFDISPAQLDKATDRIGHIRDLFLQEGLMSSEEAAATMARLATCPKMEASLAGAQYVLEAVPERLELKQQVFAEFETCCAGDAILATNTSSLRITDIAADCQHPERVAGMHWANPPELVPLVEVVRGERTSDETVAVVYGLSERLGKVPVVINRDILGFASNRLQYALLREALYLVASGIVSAQDVDRTLKSGVGFRYPWLGPLETVDLGGLDVFHGICQYLFADLSAMTGTPEFFDEIVARGDLGIKTGKGFYDYSRTSREEVLRKRDLYFIRQLKLIHQVQGE